MFTIEVGQKSRNEEFNFEQLELFHQECMGGKIEISGWNLIIGRKNGSFYERKSNFFLLICERCHQMVVIYKQSSSPSDIIRTAIDGQKREVEAFFVEKQKAGDIYDVIEKEKISIAVCQIN